MSLKIFHWPILSKKQRREKIQIFDQNMDLPLSKNANFSTFLIRHLYCLERFIFYLERYERLFVGLLDLKNRK